MRKGFLTLVSGLFLFPYLAMSDVNFKVQTIKETLAQAKTEHKLIFSVCSSTGCGPCNWMDANVYSDKGLAATLNNQLIPIKPSASLDRMEYLINCKSTPTMLFIDENGKVIHKVVGRTSLEDMKKIVGQVLSANCTGMDEKLDEASGTHKGNVCCEGLVKETKEAEHLCVKQSCVENSDMGLPFEGDARAALSCCDDSAERRIILKISGFMVHCVDQALLKEFNQSSRSNSKSNLPPNAGPKKKVFDSTVKPY